MEHVGSIGFLLEKANAGSSRLGWLIVLDRLPVYLCVAFIQRADTRQSEKCSLGCTVGKLSGHSTQLCSGEDISTWMTNIIVRFEAPPSSLSFLKSDMFTTSAARFLFAARPAIWQVCDVTM
jgi:hypothetical protein